MDKLEQGELQKALKDMFKDETFDEFVMRAYDQLTPEEQMQIGDKL
jgi:hypothetical protein